jgi:very-short-patch-repair endonuclease
VYVAADLARTTPGRTTPGTSNGDRPNPRSRDTPLLDRRFNHHGEAIAVFRAAIGPAAVLSGPSAAWALGVRQARSDDPVEITLPPARRLRSRRGLRIRGDLLLPGETVATPFGLATSPARTAFDLSRRDRPDRALGWVDAVLRETGAGVPELQQLIAAHPGSRGVRQARTLVALADPRAESPRESMLRWMLLNAGLPAPTPQLVVHDLRGRFVARLDLGWEAVKVGAEYDGSHHRERTQHSRDLARHNTLRALGWAVIQIDAAQLRHPDSLIALFRGLLSR